MGRKMLGVGVGLAAGFAVIVLLQAVGQAFWPLPAGLDPRDREAIVAVIHGMPATFLLWTALAWMCGALAGTYAALRVARDPRVAWPALTVEAILLAMGAFNVAALAYPAWFWAVGLSAFPLGAFVGIRWGRRDVQVKMTE